MLNIYFFLSFAQRKKLILVLFLGWGARVMEGWGGEGVSVFLYFHLKWRRLSFIKIQGSRYNMWVFVFVLIFHPDHTLSDKHTPYCRKLYISIMLLKGKKTLSISLNYLKSSNSENISFCSLQNVHCSRCI